MSVSRTRRVGPTPADVEFRALEVDIAILPTFKLPVLEGLDGAAVHYGPLQPPQKAFVPLWMAVHLKKKRKCRIVVPGWLAVAELEATLRRETTSGDFSALPRDYLEVAKVLLEVAADDIPTPDKVRILLKDIREARQSKIRMGLQALNPIHLAMPNLSHLEISELRPFFSLAHKRLTTLDPDAERHSEIEELWLEKPGEARRMAEMGEFEMATELDIDPSSFPSFKGRTALITGGSSGIGLATATLLLSLGCNVIVGDLSPLPAGLAAKKGIAYQRTDITSYKEQLALFRAAKERFGSYPDIVFANAGIGEKGDLFAGVSDDNIEEEPKHEVVAVDLVAVANTVRIGWWGIQKEGKGGSIVMTASMAGYSGQPALPMYNGAKHAVVGLLRSLRFSAPSAKIAISLVAPAITSTPLLTSTTTTYQEVSSSLAAAGVPLNTPERIAETVVWLLSKGRQANGMGLLVQGGKVVDLEKGIHKLRPGWMGEGMAKMYKSGSEVQLFEGLRDDEKAKL